jgi:hypothetical protein
MGIIATDNAGRLNPIPNCYIRAENFVFYMYSIPTLTDGKTAKYNDETGMGRTQPFKTFNDSGTRTIGWTVTLISYDAESIARNISYLRAFEAFVYPRRDFTNTVPYVPPVVLSIRCGDLLSSYGTEVNVVCTQYQITFPQDQVWNHEYKIGTYLPSKLDVTLTFEVVYDSRYLPGADRILVLGV